MWNYWISVALEFIVPHTSAIVYHEEGTEKETEEVSVYSNRTSELLMNWQNSFSNQKSNQETTRLVCSVLLHPQFQLADLVNFNASKENRKANAAEEKASFLWMFRCALVDIDVPSGSAHEASQMFSISGLHYHHITTLIKEAFESPISKNFHLLPFKLFRKLPDCEDSDRVYTEIYNLDVLLDEHDKVQCSPTGDPTCKRKKVVAALMFWSDATHLATFGTAKMWPIYLLFGNLSKYIWCQPNLGVMKHLAYIPSLPNLFQDELKSFHHKWDTQKKDILTHCQWELMHTVWKFILDEDFLYAYTYRIVMKSLDGIERWVYPCILTYSADYPEKYIFILLLFPFVLSLTVPFRVLLTTICNKGLCPCLRCLIPKPKMDRMGHLADAKIRNDQACKYLDIKESVKNAWKAIYEQGAPIGGVYVQQLLKPTSTVPMLVSSEFFSYCSKCCHWHVPWCNLECIYRETWWRFWSFTNACCWLHA